MIQRKTGSKVMPVRIQRKRTRGWRMPQNTVYVGRPTKWGNPFRVKPSWIEWWDIPECVNAEEAVDKYEKSIDEHDIILIRAELHGKNLACWCKLGEPCHADVLLRLANK